MAPPTIESLTGMGLLGKKDHIITEVLSLRDDTKRKAYFDKFCTAYGGIDKTKHVRWGWDSNPSACGIRCNANIVLMELGAKIPAEGLRAEKEIRPTIRYPLTALGEWGIENLTVAQSTYKGMDRILISEPAKMPITRYYEYLPKKVHDTRNAVCTQFVTDYVGNNAGLEREHVTVKFVLMRCNFAMEHRGDVEDHTYHTHGMELNEIDLESSIKAVSYTHLTLPTILLV